jgi:hypothetical protein
MNTWTRALATLLACCSAIAVIGCVGEVSAPPPADERVATMNFTVDSLDALYSAECKQNSKQCLLPNTNDCKKLIVEVYGDGRAIGFCLQESGAVVRLEAGKLPLQCRSDTARYSLQCIDVNGNLALDASESASHVYPARGSAAYQRFIGSGGSALGEGSGFLEGSPQNPQNPNPDNSSTPAPGPKPPPPESSTPSQPAAPDQACADRAKDYFVKSFNDVLHKEGIKFWYKPTSAGSSGGFFSNGTFQSNPAEICKQASVPACDKKAVPQGTCYCWNGFLGGTCKGAPMVDAALAAACSKILPGCDAGKWATEVWDASRGAVQWLNQAQAQADAAKAAAGTAAALAAAGSILALLITADPLVLDLEGNGIELSSAAEGVRFDLTGAGATRTAWVVGKDDALLALDLDGNGRIDDGRELLGDAFALGGRRARDGFEALALLDDNGDGRVDARDARYAELLLWRDANHDGVSQPGELRPLAKSGIRALEVRSTTRELTDRHGNDLSTQGTFVWRSGRLGRMADAFLVNR